MARGRCGATAGLLVLAALAALEGTLDLPARRPSREARPGRGWCTWGWAPGKRPLTARQVGAAAVARDEEGLLDEELAALAAAVLPRPADRDAKTQLLELVGELAREVHGADAKVYGFGSSVNACGEAQSDVDAVLYLPPVEDVEEEPFPAFALRRLADIVQGTAVERRLRGEQEMERRAQEEGGNDTVVSRLRLVERRLGAAVPIITLELLDGPWGSPTGYTCDLSFRHMIPLYNTQLLRTYTTLAPCLPILAAVIKRWAKAEGIAKTFEHYISSYSWTLLLVYYLQVVHGLPSLHALVQHRPGRAPPRPGPYDIRFVGDAAEAQSLLEAHSGEGQATPTYRTASLGELLRGFFDFYVREYDWEREVVSIRVGARRMRGARGFSQHLERSTFFIKGAKRLLTLPGSLHIEDPIEVQRNLNFALTPESILAIQERLASAAARLEPGAPSARGLGPLGRLLSEVPHPHSEPAPWPLPGMAASLRGKGTSVEDVHEAWLRGCLPVPKMEAWPVRCNRCGQLFRSFIMTLEHEAAFKCKSRAMRCIVCSKPFFRERDLKSHYKDTPHGLDPRVRGLFDAEEHSSVRGGGEGDPMEDELLEADAPSRADGGGSSIAPGRPRPKARAKQPAALPPIPVAPLRQQPDLPRRPPEELLPPLPPRGIRPSESWP